MRPLVVFLLIALTGGVACGGKPTGVGGVDAGDAGDDAGPDAGLDTTYPAFMPDVPQVKFSGGPVLEHPLIVPVYFANDNTDSETTLLSFEQGIGATSYWSTAVGEYGVGAATAATAFMSSDMPTGTMQSPITDADIQSWILNEIANDPTFPPPTPDTIYAMHYPAGVVISLQSGGSTAYSCDTFGGYHEEIQLPTPTETDAGLPYDQAYVAYAVIPRCTNFGALTGLNGTTGAESHELVEASTDPYPDYRPAYAEVDNDHITWELAFGGGEVGDMCAQDPQAFTQFSGFPYTVQRIWSNSSAKAGHDPCVPYLPNEVYFNSVPDMSDTFSAEGLSVESFNVEVGKTGVTPVNLFSDGPMTQPWQVQVVDVASAEGGNASTDFLLNQTTGLNGGQLQLTVEPKTSTRYGADLFFVISTAADGTSHYWVGTVGEQ